jgi:hypothetical protein
VVCRLAGRVVRLGEKNAYMVVKNTYYDTRNSFLLFCILSVTVKCFLRCFFLIPLHMCSGLKVRDKV